MRFAHGSTRLGATYASWDARSVSDDAGNATPSDMDTSMSEGTMSSQFPLDALFLPERAQTREVAPVIGRFSILHEIGQGGMGVVYLGYDARLDRRAAVKLLGSNGEQGRARLLREAQALARLSHPNVIPIYESGEHGDDAYIAMEYVAGHTLRDWMRAAPRSTAQILAVFVAAGRGLEAAHQQGLAHRDFKPDNVMVGDDGRTRVADFGLVRAFAEPSSERPRAELDAQIDAGIARIANVDLTATGALLGTPAYMAPEQYLGEPSGPATDQFSFCVSLWEALYGTRPFAGKSVAELATNILAGKIATPSGDAKLPARIRKALEQGLAVEPGKRWPSMGALLTVLERELSMPQRRTFAVTASVVVAALLAVVGFAWQRVAARDEAAAAESRLALAERRALQSAELLAEGESVDALVLAIRAAGGLIDESSLRAQLPHAVSQSLHDASTAELRFGVVEKFSGWASVAAFTADGTHLALAQGTLVYGLEHDYIEIRSVQACTAKGGECTKQDGVVTATLTGHRCAVQHMQFFADDSRLLAHCYEDGGAHLWDRSGALLASFDTMALARVSPAGAVVATRSGHDVNLTGTSGDTVATLHGHTGEPTVLEFSADGSRLATAGPDAVRIWDAESGEALTVLDHADVVIAAWFADGSGRLATLAMDQHVRIWKAESGELLDVLAPGAGQEYSSFAPMDVHGLVAAPDGSRVALYIDRKLWLWDAATGELILHLVDHGSGRRPISFQPDKPNIRPYTVGAALQFSPDSSRMVFLRNDSSILLLDAGRGAAIRESGRSTSGYSFTPDSEFLAVGHDGVEIWDADTGARVTTLEGPSPSDLTVLSPSGRLLLTRGVDANGEWAVDVWDTQVVPSSLSTLSKTSASAVVLAVAPVGGHVMMADAALATISDASSGKQLSKLEGHAGGVRLAVFSRDGQVLAAVDREEVLHVWDAASGKLIGGPVELKERVTALALSDDGAHVATGSGELVRVRDVRSGAVVLELDGHWRQPDAIAFSPDGQLLATVDIRMRLWAFPSGELIHELDSVEGDRVVFSPDGTRLGTDRAVWDVATGTLINELGTSYLADGPVVFSPAGTTLVAGGKLWDGFTGANLDTLEGHEQPIAAVGFLEGGDRMVTASRDAILVRDAAPAMAAACTRLQPYGVTYGEVAAICDPVLQQWEAARGYVPERINLSLADARWVVESVWALTLLALMLATGLSGRLERLCSKLPHARVLAGPAYHLSIAVVLAILVVVGVNQFSPPTDWLDYGWPVAWVLSLTATLGFVLRRSPDRWWMWASLATIAIAATCMVLAPELVAKIHELTPTGSATLVSLAQPFEHMDAHTSYSGFAAHASGHQALHHGLQSLVVFGVVISLGLFGVHKFASFVAKHHGERLGFTSIGARGALPLMLLLIVAFGLVSAPVQSALVRQQERQADRFALEHGGNAQSCAATAAMQSDRSGLDDASPSWVTRIWHARQPGLAERIADCGK
jgi:WD40 repeat protein/predicted Ser/Thr protein kinase